MKKSIKKIGISLSLASINSGTKEIEKALQSIQKEKAEAVLPKKRNPFGQVKREVSEEKKNRILASVQHLAVMSEMIGIEYQTEMDALFPDPYLNNLTNRIGTDCLAIASRIKNGNLPKFEIKDADHADEYAGELHRLFKLFIGMELSKIVELLDGWEKISRNITEEDDLNYVTIGFTPEELEEIGRVVKRKGISEELKIKLEAVIKESAKKVT